MGSGPLSRLLVRARSGELSCLAAKYHENPEERSGQARTPRQRQVRLSASKKRELVERYQAGALQRELALTYGIHSETVRAIIAASGVPKQRQGLDAQQINEAIVRYATGESLATVGKALGVDAVTVRRRLIERGVRMRDTSGQKR